MRIKGFSDARAGLEVSLLKTCKNRQRIFRRQELPEVNPRADRGFPSMPDFK